LAVFACPEKLEVGFLLLNSALSPCIAQLGKSNGRFETFESVHGGQKTERRCSWKV